MKLNIPENIEKIKPYPPGKPLDELEREYGITNSIKLASNESAWGPSPQVVNALRAELDNLHRYPDGSSYYLTQAIAEKFGVRPEEVVLGNGSNEIIEFLVKALVGSGDTVISSHPSFLMYQKFVQVRGGENHVVPLKEMGHDLEAIKEKVSDRTRLIFIDNPNNPTGTAIDPQKLQQFLRDIPEHVTVVLDEAYVDFMDSALRLDVVSYIRENQDSCAVVFMRTFSKAYALSGLRVGFGLMPEQLAGCLHKVRQPFNINRMAQVGALAALEDEDYYQQTLRLTAENILFLREEVDKLGCTSYPTHTNFFLIDVKGDADKLYQAMLYEGVIIRSMSAYGFDSFIRITVGTKEENQRFLKSLAKCLKELGYV
ncbi:histidinol-phosphate transaminase [Desulforhopalus singaporensis]|uniref:Histidinol-phosphate aminotransferase n=1 Tax=Desulforhopalus singaporensis TaxID=91360 RepID=A0A1H0V9F9_9BACT|nr:histidinol-phosphate transaminase [Desulforhopalus singaporensis]SDP75209.1 histidinol phosphate aminotransferase apoenzyme [Desulforhopalus singaporensis]